MVPGETVIIECLLLARPRAASFRIERSEKWDHGCLHRIALPSCVCLPVGAGQIAALFAVEQTLIRAFLCPGKGDWKEAPPLGELPIYLGTNTKTNTGVCAVKGGAIW